MVDLEQLEKLSVLREKGILTDEEFETEKARLLHSDEQNGKKFPYAPLAGLLILGVIAVVAGLLLTGHNDAYQPDTLPSSKGGDIITATVSDGAKNNLAKVLAEEPETDNYQWAVSSNVIGLNPAYLESKLGVPKEKSKFYWVFDVGGCEIDYSIDDQVIQSLFTRVTSKCHPIVDGKKLTPRTKFLSLMQQASLFSSCIGGSCGNATDPTIDLLSRGGSFNQFIDVKFQGQYSDVTSEAIDQWESYIKRQRGLDDDDFDNVDPDWFTCISDAPDEVVTTMRQEVVTGVSLGRDLNVHCSF